MCQRITKKKYIIQLIGNNSVQGFSELNFFISFFKSNYCTLFDIAAEFRFFFLFFKCNEGLHFIIL